MLFSILVPVYNVEKYLAQCIESVLTQDFDDYELILVNDGSTDKSPDICQAYADQDGRIKYYSKNNEGLLLTRRYGIQRAKGDYVLFLDSDDFWEPGLLKKLQQEIKKYAYDLIVYRFKRLTDEGKLIREDRGIFPDHTFFDDKNKKDFILQFVSSSRLNVMWSKCVRRQILDVEADYSRFKDKKGEDLLQSIAIVKNARTVLYLDDALYNYRLSPSGRGRNFKFQYMIDYEAVRKHVLSQLGEMNCDDKIIRAFYIRYIDGVMHCVPSIARISKNCKEFLEHMKEIKSFSVYREALSVVKPEEMANRKHQLLYSMVLRNRMKRMYYLCALENCFKKALTMVKRKKR